MLIAEIKRETIAFPAVDAEGLVGLAEDAASILGYGVLRSSLETPAQKPRLAQTLAELGIETLNRADVISYMRERLCERTLERVEAWQKSGPEPLSSWGYGMSFSGPSWEATPIARYREAIPEFVVNKAVQIKRALPEVDIFIRHLTDDKDPFLEVTLGDATEWDADENGSERYFVEVWEEPKFEGRLR